MLNIEDNGLFEIFPMIKTISDSFEYQNSMLNKIVLTGKINALEIAENLFDFTQKTAETFTSLQEKLISNMLEENKNELVTKSSIQANIILDLLQDSFSNKKRELEILSLNNDIKKYFYDISFDIKKLLSFYENHNQYLDVILLNLNGKVLFNLNKNNRVRYSKDVALKEVLKSDGTIFKFETTDLYVRNKKSLYALNKIEEDGKILGFVAIIYDVTKELDLIFNTFVKDKEYIVIRYQGDILLSSEKGIDNKFIKKIKGNKKFSVVNNRFFYKAISDIDDKLEVIISYPMQADINIIAEFNNKQVNNRELIEIGINNQELKKLANEGYEILEDLSDVIINGELIAAKSKQYVLIPILDNLREVSFRVIKLIEFSISNLQKIIYQSISNSSNLFAKSINELIARYIYICSLDIRLWALDNDILDFSDINYLTKKLKQLNDLSPKCSDIFVYDENSKIIAISNSQHLVGEFIEKNYTSRNFDDNMFFMTHFTNTKLYTNKPTYVFYATLIKDSKIIGGIGVVLDAEVQFNSVLTNIFKDNDHILGLMVNKDKKVIASNNKEEFDILSDFDLIENELKTESLELTYKDKQYQVSVVQSEGYKDFHTDELFSIVMMEK